MHGILKKTVVWTAAGVGVALAARAVTRQLRAMSLGGRTALITGGSRGLGLVLARTLAREGVRLAIVARDGAELERAGAELATLAVDVLGIPADVTDPVVAESAVCAVLDRFGSIDVLINNAGTIQVGPFDVTTPEDYRRALETHFWVPFYMTRAVVPAMRARRMGRIVNISSIGGKVSVPHLLPYGTSKFALTGFSEGLRAELAKDGILVTTVIPGLMRTGSPRNALFKGQHRAEYAWFSISDSLPLVSTSAESAARKIVNAFRYGDAEAIVSLPAQLAVRFQGLFPGLSADVLGLVNRFLPSPGGVGTQNVAGRDSTSPLSPSWLTTLTDRAAVRNNETAIAH